MARPINHSGAAYTIPVVMKLNPEGITVLDRLRGTTPRGTYMRDLLKAEVKREQRRLPPVRPER